jgi:tetratricopeptide (TPR) repeat protein
VPTTVYYDSYDGIIDTVVDVREAEPSPSGEVIHVEAKPRVAKPESKESLAQRQVALGDFYFREGRFGEAVEAYRRALDHVPEDGTVHLALADALFATGDYHQAAYVIGKALELDPELAAVQVDKRAFYGDPTLLDKQLDTLKRYIEDKPFDAAAHFMLGYNLRLTGQLDGARRAFERVLELDGDHAAARMFLDALARPASSDGAKRREVVVR